MTTSTTTRLQTAWLTLAAAAAFSLISISCFRIAQTPAPDAPAARETTAQETAAAQAADRERPGEGTTPLVNAGRPVAPIEDYTPQPPILPLTPEEEQERFVLPPGYRLEPVLTEPAIQEPMQIAFDGNGRLFVLEMRSYMQDANATDELTPTSRISMHEDTDGDGVYDRHTVYVDSMVVTRFVMPFGPSSILTMESNTDEVYEYTDTDGDGVADERVLFTTDYGRSGNIEHQQSSMMWAMDNWMYATYHPFRIRWTPDGVIREETGSTHSQWGVTQDDDGKVWFQGGASGVPGYFQFPIVYGNFDVEDELEEGFRVPYGLAGVGDYQPGPGASRPDGTLNEVTGAAGSDVFRGHRLPEELRGDYFYGEPVARIVRRIRPVVTEGLTQLRNVYQAERSEFIRSTDPLFRPVQMQTAPDGTMYIVDPYRGIIQEGNWTRPGTHLRKKIEQYGLDRVNSHGRIWRLTHEDTARDRTRPRMNDETPAQLVRHLAHPNGWWRDTAQRLLVLHQDRSVVPALRAMVRDSDDLLARFHALWTLEGLGALDAALVRALMEDPHPRMRIQAARAGETLYKAGDRSLAADYRKLARDRDPEVVIQALMTLNVLGVPEAADVVREAMAAHAARGVQVVGAQILDRQNREEHRFSSSRFTEAQRALLENGARIYGELCAECHGEDGRGTPFGDEIMAPALVQSARVQGHRDYVVKTLLHGLTGPIEGRTYPGAIMVPMGANTDEWIASAASFVRNSFGNEGILVTPEYAAEVRAATAGRSAPYTYEELVASLPRELLPQPSWKASASHTEPTRLGGTGSAAAAFDFEGWTTGGAQEPGMWFQIELPEPARITEIRFDSPTLHRGRGPDAPPPVATSPRGYRVQVSMDGRTWRAPVAVGQGGRATTVISFEPVRAKYIRITQTAEAEDVPWSMQMLRVYEAGRER